MLHEYHEYKPENPEEGDWWMVGEQTLLWHDGGIWEAVSNPKPVEYDTFYRKLSDWELNHLERDRK